MTPLAQAITEALVQFIWQGILVSLVVAAAAFLLRRQSPNVRYLLYCVALLALAALPVITAIELYDPLSANRSGGFQVIRRGFAGLPIRDNVVGDFLSLVQAVHAGTLNGADVDENVLAAVIRLDEAKAFLAVEPLHGSLRHETLLSVRV